MSLRVRLLEFMRVPAAPSAPAGDHDVRIFRAAPNFLRYKLVLWGLKQVGALAGIIFGMSMLRFVPDIRIPVIGISAGMLADILEVCAVIGFAAQVVWSLALVRLDFDQRWYLVSDRSLRIREGIVRMHEKTMTFANLQNVTIKQGPLQRVLGIADVEVRTAGGGGGGSSDELHHAKKDEMHVAYFRGVADAESIRNTIRERLKRHADSGLGDPDDLEHLPGAHVDDGLLAAARALADEARALREQLPNS
jgi:membrane protein YdbS with pleckstrin-like domain